MSSALVIKDLRVSIDDKPILKGLNLEVKLGEIHAIMGPNGSGKSTMAYALAGHPRYEVEGGEVWMDGINLLELEPDERARMTELIPKVSASSSAVNSPFSLSKVKMRRRVVGICL